MSYPRPRMAWRRAAAILLSLAMPFALADIPQLDDQEIADAIEDQYILDGTIDVNRIDIEVTNGIAQLTGSVDNLLAKERASGIAARVKGVRSVSNRINVVPPLVMADEGIQQNIVEALRADPAADADEIGVSVEEGIATLNGEVESFAEMELTATVAKSVRGVIALDNDIAVQVPNERSAAEIRDEVQQRLRWNVLVDDGLIDVSVRDGQVILEGAVGSLEEKRLAESLARVAGVSGVDVRGLSVEWWAEDEELRNDEYPAKTAEQIEKAIQDAALYDPRLLSFRIEPDVLAGWVTLRGSVDNLEAKRAAERVARSTVGVRGVTNRIKVRPDEDLADELIEAKVHGRLLVSPLVDAGDVEIEVYGGRTVLSGAVDSYLERMEAERLAGLVNGVTQVSNRTVVEYDRGAASPYYGYEDPTMSASGARRLPPLRNDQHIRDDIRGELFWSPFVDSDQVDVDVVDGTATLTGTVETWREYHAAEENAYEGGALSVSNLLKVK